MQLAQSSYKQSVKTIDSNVFAVQRILRENNISGTHLYQAYIFRVASHFHKNIQEQFKTISSTLINMVLKNQKKMTF